MRIQPFTGITPSYGASRPTASVGLPADRVQLSGQDPSYAHLGGVGLATAAQAAAGATYGPLEMGRALEARGVKFQYMGRGLDFWNEKWKDAPADKAVKWLGEGTQVQFQLPGFGWTALQNPETLGLVFAFHGGGQLDTLKNPQLAQNLQKLSLKDTPAWQAYQKILNGGSVGSDLQSPEDVALAVFLKTGQAPPDLKDPARAQTLQSLQSFTLSSGDIYSSYRNLPPEVTVSTRGETMGVWKTDQPVDLKALQEQQERFESLRQELGSDAARPVWRLLSQDGSSAPYAERLELYRATKEEKLYTEALQENLPLGPLAERLKQVVVAKHPLEAARALERSPDKPRFLAHLKDFPGELSVAERVTALPPAAADVVKSARADWNFEGDWSAGPSGWKDNAAGKYQANQKAVALTSRPFSLHGVKRAELTFEAGYDLEQDRDKVVLEARPAGGAWKALQTFSGKQASQPYTVSLHDFLNGEVELRFAITTDHSEERAGIEIRNLSVKADGKVLLTHAPGAGREEVLRELEKPGTDVPLLAGFMQGFASTGEALTAWASLGPSPKADEATALAGLSRELGAETAAMVWPDLVTGAGSWDERKSRAVETHKLATELAAARQSDDLATSYATLKQLPDDARRATQELLDATRLSDWTSSASWGWDPREKVWSTNPGKATYANHCKDTLTGPTLDLTGRQGCSLRLDARWELEDKYDSVTLQASGDDGHTWTDLRKFESKSDWSHQNLSLSAFEGKKARLRWLLTTDGSGERPGLAFKNLAVTASGGNEVYVDRPEKALQTSTMLWELAARGDGASLVEAARLKDVGANEALRLQPVLARAGDRKPEVEALVRSLGLEAALPQADLVLAGHSPQEVETAYRTASKLAQALGSPLDVKLPGQMLASGFDAGMSADLGALADSYTVYAPGSRWVRRPDGSMDDSPDASYRPNEDSALEVRAVDLKGLTSPRLCYEATHALEEKYDHVQVEVDDGSGWKSLATHDGAQGWQAYTRDLSAYQDKSVRIRFRLTSDGSGERDGMTLRKLAVKGLNSAGQEEVRLQDHGTRADGLDVLMRSVFRPGQDQATLKMSLETLRMLTEGLGDPGQALTVWDLSGSDPDKARDLGLLVHYAGWEQSRQLWFVLKDLPPEQRTHKTELLALGAQLSERGVDALKVQSRLEASDLDSEGLSLLADLSASAGNGSWVTTGSWARVKTPHGPGWSDSPNGNYQSNQSTTVTLPALDLHGAKSPRLRYQATFSTESGPDTIRAQVSRDGKTWQTLQTHTGDSSWVTFESDLKDFAGSLVSLRFQLVTDGSVEKEGITLANVTVVDDGKELYRDRGGADVMDGVLDLACDASAPLAMRKKSLTVLAGLPDGIGWRALALLREEEKAGRLKGVSLAHILQRLPAAIVSDDLGAAIERIVKEGASTGILEEENAIRVGGVRMKRKEASE